MRTINVTDNNVSELIDMLSKLNEKNLHLYWTILEQDDKSLLDSMKDSMNQVLEHYKKQIAKLYMLNLVEQNILNREDTQLNELFTNLKDKLDSKKVMDASIVNRLYLTNIDTIFNNTDYTFDYNLSCDEQTTIKIEDNEYVSSAFCYINSLGDNKKMKKKILNIVQ